MKIHTMLLLTVCVALWSFASSLPKACAEALPQNTVQLSLISRRISLGEPIILSYKITNPASHTLSVNVDDDPAGWLQTSLRNAAGYSVSDVRKTSRVQHYAGIAISAKSSYTGYLVVSQVLNPILPGQYTLNLSTHVISTWQDIPGESAVENHVFSLPLTVSERDPKRLAVLAEAFRQDSLSGTNTGKWEMSIKALFALPQSAVLPIWRKLALDPNLDAFRAKETIQHLAKVQTTDACDLLADMQEVSPERWSRIGTSPLAALENARGQAGPALQPYIDKLLTEEQTIPGGVQTGIVK